MLTCTSCHANPRGNRKEAADSNTVAKCRKGELVLFHMTFKAKTDRCLPSRICRAEEQFSRPVLFSFGFSKKPLGVEGDYA